MRSNVESNELCEYEKYREDNIREIQEFLKNSGLLEEVQDLRAEKETEEQSKIKAPRVKKQQCFEKQRKSDRIAQKNGLTVEDYEEQEVELILKFEPVESSAEFDSSDQNSATEADNNSQNMSHESHYMHNNYLQFEDGEYSECDNADRNVSSEFENSPQNIISLSENSGKAVLSNVFNKL